MNTVPFDQLGPGQSGRLAYQVMGQNGPIFNPSNIAYLPPDSPSVASFTGAGASGLSVGLSGVNLISSFLNLAVSGYIAYQVRALHDKMDILQETVSRIEHKIDYIREKVERIDMQVAENNLREALKYALQKAISKDGVDLSALSCLERDINKLFESSPLPLLLNFDFQLSSDVRDRLQNIWGLTYEVRKLVARKHNAFLGGDPERIITVDPIEDYFLIWDSLKTCVKATMHIPADSTEEAGWMDFDDSLPVHHSELFSEEEQSANQKAQFLYELGTSWLYHTDAGLLWRTYLELAAIDEGYENVFWLRLQEDEPCRIDRIDVVCDLPLIENS